MIVYSFSSNLWKIHLRLLIPLKCVVGQVFEVVVEVSHFRWKCSITFLIFKVFDLEHFWEFSALRTDTVKSFIEFAQICSRISNFKQKIWDLLFICVSVLLYHFNKMTHFLWSKNRFPLLQSLSPCWFITYMSVHLLRWYHRSLWLICFSQARSMWTNTVSIWLLNERNADSSEYQTVRLSMSEVFENLIQL